MIVIMAVLIYPVKDAAERGLHQFSQNIGFLNILGIPNKLNLPVLILNGMASYVV